MTFSCFESFSASGSFVTLNLRWSRIPFQGCFQPSKKKDQGGQVEYVNVR